MTYALAKFEREPYSIADIDRTSGYHSLEHEFRFLDRLGTWTPQGRKIGKAGCLKRYLAALEKRVRGLNGRDLLTAEERSRLRARAQVVLEAVA